MGTVRIACSAVLFDLDGVLIDSTPAVERVWARWASEHGFDPKEVVRKAHGRPSISTIREYLPHADIERENSKVELGELEDMGGVVPLSGAVELLNSLPPERWTIVTSCTRRLALARLGAAGLLAPKHLLTCTDVQNGKPHPEPYLAAAAALGLAATDCVVIEDAPAGIRSGKAAGARVIAVKTTAEEDTLQGAGADWIVKDCSSISALSNWGARQLGLAIEVNSLVGR
ncbi:MAG TPA: HAD family hydrolase [Terriglobales bacterium]|nr:HAD family hydrolase [Terriglobales bacterium]